jgi:hypothetical protein
MSFWHCYCRVRVFRTYVVATFSLGVGVRGVNLLSLRTYVVSTFSLSLWFQPPPLPLLSVEADPPLAAAPFQRVIWAVLPVTVLASAGLFCCCAVRITVTTWGYVP